MRWFDWGAAASGAGVGAVAAISTAAREGFQGEEFVVVLPLALAFGVIGGFLYPIVMPLRRRCWAGFVRLLGRAIGERRAAAFARWYESQDAPPPSPPTIF